MCLRLDHVTDSRDNKDMPRVTWWYAGGDDMISSNGSTISDLDCKMTSGAVAGTDDRRCDTSAALLRKNEQWHWPQAVVSSVSNGC